MTRQLRVLAPLLLVGLFLVALPFLGNLWQRYNPINGSWPGSYITYYNASEYRVSLREAFRRWEETGLHIRFREIQNKEDADLVVYSDTEGLRERCTDHKRCTGWATVGHTPFRQAEMWLLPPSNPYENRVQDFLMMPTLIHEVGHVLGLPHNDEFCSVMNTDDPACGALERPQITKEGRQMLCGPWARDLDNLRELYPEVGQEYSGWCQDPRASWDFFVRHGDTIVEGIRRFRENSGDHLPLFSK